MKSKSMLRNGILFLVIALIIGSFGVIALAKNNANQGRLGQGINQGSQSQIQARVQNQSQLQTCEEECNQNCTGDCTGECDGSQVQISGAELKSMTISDIAKLWEIDATALLNKIVSTFNLEETYTVESTINDLRSEYRFSPFQIKDIANNLKVS